MKGFLIQIANFLGGFLPNYWESNYPSYGNDNMAGKMKNIDLTSPHYIQAGPGISTLTNGDQSGAVNVLIKRIIEKAVVDNITYAIGGDEVFKISSSQVYNTSPWPHTISGTSVEAQDIILYEATGTTGKYVYYTYNDSSAGDMGRFDVSSESFDDTFLSTYPTGAFSLDPDVPHPLERGGDGILYIGNGNVVATYDASTNTATAQAIDLPKNCIITDLKYYRQKLIITVNWPNLTGDNQTQQSLFIWNTVSSSWDDEVPHIAQGKGLYRKGGIIYVFYKDITSGVSKLGYLNGLQVSEVCSFYGSLPENYQIASWKGFLAWVSDGMLYAWGSGERRLPARFFQFMSGKYNTVGGIAAPFGKMLVASSDGVSNYDLSKEYQRTTDAYWYSRLFDISGASDTALVNKYKVSFENPSNNNVKATFRLKNSLGDTLLTKDIGGISKTSVKDSTSINSEDVRIEIDFSSGTTTESLKIKNIFVSGYEKE